MTTRSFDSHDDFYAMLEESLFAEGEPNGEPKSGFHCPRGDDCKVDFDPDRPYWCRTCDRQIHDVEDQAEFIRLKAQGECVLYTPPGKDDGPC